MDDSRLKLFADAVLQTALTHMESTRRGCSSLVCNHCFEILPEIPEMQNTETTPLDPLYIELCEKQNEFEALTGFPHKANCLVLLAEEIHYKELATMPYANYLATPEWAWLRKKALALAGYRCSLCNSKGKLNVHHRTYTRRGNELLGDLIVLCEACHEHFHAGRKVSKDG